jgi:hypothetical protein
MMIELRATNPVLSAVPTGVAEGEEEAPPAEELLEGVLPPVSVRPSTGQKHGRRRSGRPR